MSTYPVRVHARLDEPLSRWLWLVKWLLAIPHYVVLFFLWIAYLVLTVVAFFAILITGRYPRGIFDFNVGVLRWSWRVSYYSYDALGTDRYPPFTLEDVPDYPARLEVDYPQRLSRGLVLVKWWLLAIPHYLIVGVFAGAGFSIAYGGLTSLLTIIAGVALLFLDRYPRDIFVLVVGLNRWALRVAAYASLMTDHYPPFRLDQGGEEPTDRPVPPLATPAGSAAHPTDPDPSTVAAAENPPGGSSGARASGWTTGRVLSVVVGALLLVLGIGASAGGGAIAWADSTQRDAAGYLSTPTEHYATADYGLRSETIDLRSWPRQVDIGSWLGTVRVQAQDRQGGAVFVGIADSRDADTYCGTMPPRTPPTAQSFWVASATGTGLRTLTWEPTAGNWTLVVMNADGSSGVDADVTAGATVPGLRPVGIGLLAGGGAALLLGATLLTVAIVSASARRRTGTA